MEGREEHGTQLKGWYQHWLSESKKYTIVWKKPIFNPKEPMIDTFRKTYKPLSKNQTDMVMAMKIEADLLLNILEKQIENETGTDKCRCIAIAKTKLEEAVMWATKGITL